MKRRLSSGARLQTTLSLFLVLTCSALFPSAVVQAQGCISNRRFKVCNKPLSSDHKRHINVSFSGGDAAERAAMQAALDAWNRYSDVTGIVFDLSPSGTTGDIEISYSSFSGDTGGCAAFQSATSTVYWGDQWRSRLQNLGQGEAAAVIMHELGHALGLDENNSDFNQIMHQGDCNLTTGSTGGATYVSRLDADAVANCLTTTCSNPPQLPVHNGGYNSGGTNCHTEYVINPTYDREGVTGYETEAITVCN